MIQSYKSVRQRTLDLCEPLGVEDYTPQSAVFASPPKWHIAHVTWFFEEMILKKSITDYEVFDESFSFLFNSYYNSIGERLERHNRGLITRPTVDYIIRYRKHVDEHMINLLENNSSDELNKMIVLGINHEQQHQELLITDLKYTFSCNPLYPIYSESNLLKDNDQTTGWISIDEGIYEIGHSTNDFCFDNELGRHRVFLESFDISSSLVTNAAFIKFIEEGGYETARYWLDEGWHWLNENKIKQPLYWKNIDGEWHQYTLSGLQKIDPSGILTHVSLYEAMAFACYNDMRLPTEFEWEVASSQFNWGQRWEWTNSAYLPYPGFNTAEGPVGEYNGKFMMSQMVLRGASVATSPGHSRHTYRNFFTPETRWQYSGIRLVK